VEAEQPRLLGLRDGGSIDRDPRKRPQDRGGGLDHRTVEGDPPIRDHALDFASAGHAGTGQQLGDPLAGGSVIRRHGRALSVEGRFIQPSQ
jgi:hypothetical protein